MGVSFLFSEPSSRRVTFMTSMFGWRKEFPRCQLKLVPLATLPLTAIFAKGGTYVTTGYFQAGEALKMMEEDPNIAACQPKLLSHSEKSMFEYAGAAGGFIDKWGYPFCRGRILNNIEPDSNQYNNSIEIFWASGACLFIKSRIFHDAGGFDDDFFAHMEEIDLCWRIKNLGYKIYCYPCSQVYHVGGGTLPNETPAKLFLNFRNSLWLLLKNLPDNKLYPVLIIRKILDGLAAMKFYLTFDWKKGNAVFKAHLSYYKHSGKMKQKRKSANFKNKDLPSSVYKKSILISYFLRKKKTFNELDWQ